MSSFGSFVDPRNRTRDKNVAPTGPKTIQETVQKILFDRSNREVSIAKNTEKFGLKTVNQEYTITIPKNYFKE